MYITFTPTFLILISAIFGLSSEIIGIFMIVGLQHMRTFPQRLLVIQRTCK